MRHGTPVAAAYASALVLLVPLLTLYLVMSVLLDASDGYEQVNGTAPLYFIAVLLDLSWRLSRACPESIWSSAFWLPLQSAVFFGFGPLVEVYGNEATKLALSGHALAINQEQLFRSNMLSTVGIACLLGGFWLHAVAKRRVWTRSLQGAGGETILIPPAIFALAA